MIKVEELYKSFGDSEVLKGISLHVNDGEILVLIGRSGYGKSVLLKHVAGLMKPDRGRVLVDGGDMCTLSGKDLLQLRNRLGFLFQPLLLFHWQRRVRMHKRLYAKTMYHPHHQPPGTIRVPRQHSPVVLVILPSLLTYSKFALSLAHPIALARTRLCSCRPVSPAPQSQSYLAHNPQSVIPVS